MPLPTEKESRHEVELGTVLEQSRTNSQQISELGKRLDNFAQSVNSAIEVMSARIGKAGRTDWQTVFLGCSFIVTLLAYPLYSLNEKNHELDIKLQREFSLALETQKEGLANLNQISKERHDSVIALTVVNSDRVKRLEDWEKDTLRDDLNELRARRMKDKP